MPHRPTSQRPAGRVFLHVGLHKTGTTYVQQLMRANRQQLRAHGVLYPGGDGFPSQVLAVFDLLGRRPRGAGRDNRITGAWQAMVDGVHAAGEPTVLVSDEHLSLATPRQARTAVQSFPDHEVHVVATVRDLARVLTSAWQEEVKNRGPWTWEEFSAAVQDPTRAGTSPARGFWLRQDAPAILATWAALLPVQRVHVVTVPPADSSPAVLVDRLAGLVGLDPATLSEPATWANETVGLLGTEVIRRINPRLSHLNQRQFDRAVKATLVRELAEHAESVRCALPPGDLAWAQAKGAQMSTMLRAAGYPVVGDLAELEGHATPGRLPHEVGDAELLEVAVAALAGMADQYATAWWSNKRPDDAVESGGRTRGASKARALGFRVKRATGRFADRHPVAGKALGAYLRLGRTRNRP